MRIFRVPWFLMLAVMVPVALRAQDIRVTVHDSANGRPVAGAVLLFLDAAGATISRTLTNERGEYRGTLASPAHRVRALRLGFRAREVPVPATDGAPAQVNIAMLVIPTLLEPVNVRALASCPARSDAPAAFALLEQARAGLLATIVAREANPATLKLLRYERMMEGVSDRVDRQTVRVDSGTKRAVSFAAAGKARDFIRSGFTSDSGSVRTYYGTDAEVLLDDDFLLGYCLRLESSASRPHQVGLGFGAAERQKGRIDIQGTLWIDTVARSLRDIQYEYAGSVEHWPGVPPQGGSISFHEMPNGVAFIDRWRLTLVAAGSDTTFRAGSNGPSVHRWFFLRASGGEVARAIWADGTMWKGSLGTVHLHVVDDKGKPARNLIVRLGDSDYLGSADERGDIEFTDVFPGPYKVNVIHPDLAEKGIVLGTPLKLFADRDSTSQATLIAPPIADFRRAACDREAGASWLVVSVVRDKAPAAEAKWEFGEELGTATEFVSVTGFADKDGHFAFCYKVAPGIDQQLRISGAEGDRPVKLDIGKPKSAMEVDLGPLPKSP
ncbi:MAG: carboxypeptidase-like regulatory domain-containing protein [Gemmatimonadaceae bacterium]